VLRLSNGSVIRVLGRAGEIEITRSFPFSVLPLSHKNKCIGMTWKIGLKTPVYAMK
jgi:hypothetical protein